MRGDGHVLARPLLLFARLALPPPLRHGVEVHAAQEAVGGVNEVQADLPLQLFGPLVWLVLAPLPLVAAALLFNPLVG